MSTEKIYNYNEKKNLVYTIEQINDKRIYIKLFKFLNCSRFCCNSEFVDHIRLFVFIVRYSLRYITVQYSLRSKMLRLSRQLRIFNTPSFSAVHKD